MSCVCRGQRQLVVKVRGIQPTRTNGMSKNSKINFI